MSKKANTASAVLNIVSGAFIAIGGAVMLASGIVQASNRNEK